MVSGQTQPPRDSVFATLNYGHPPRQDEHPTGLTQVEDTVPRLGAQPSLTLLPNWRERAEVLSSSAGECFLFPHEASMSLDRECHSSFVGP